MYRRFICYVIVCAISVLVNVLIVIGQSIGRTSGSSLTVLPHSPSSNQLHDNIPNNQLSPAFNSAQHSIDMFMKVSGNLSPGRPPPPPYFPPPPPGSNQQGISPSSVIQNNSSHKHLNNSPGGKLASPHNYNSATWERPIHRGGAVGSIGAGIRPNSQLGGNHQIPHNNMTSSMSKLTVPPPLGMLKIFKNVYGNPKISLFISLPNVTTLVIY